MPGKLKHVTDGYARSREAFFRLMTGNECWSKQCWKELCCAVMLMRHGLIKIGVSQRQEYCILSFKITLKLVTNLTLIKLQTCNLQLTIDTCFNYVTWYVDIMQVNYEACANISTSLWIGWFNNCCLLSAVFFLVCIIERKDVSERIFIHQTVGQSSDDGVWVFVFSVSP